MTRIELVLLRTATLFPDKVAIRDAHREVTWTGFLEESRRLARALAGIGIGPGDRVVVLAHNQITYAALYFSCAFLSAVLVPLNTRLLPREIRSLVERSHAKVVIADARFAGLLGELPSGCQGFSIDAPIAGWNELSSLPPTGTLSEGGEASAVAVQMYTSGTTGLPKGAMLTHANVVSMALSWLLEVPLRSPEDTFLQLTPLYHVGALLMLMSCVTTGARMLLHDFAPATVARCLASEGVTHTLMVPAMIRFFLDGLGKADTAFPHLRVVAYGASPIPVPQLRRALDRFGCDMVQGYGLTETAGVITALRIEDHRYDVTAPPPARLASAGRAVLGSKVRVVRKDGSDVSVGEVGEVVARGPNVFVGYHEMPEATAEAFRDGWFHTGDLATIDELGYVTMVDRSKDMIIVGGENVYPSEVETVLREHPLVSDVAVIGIPNETWGEAILALVVAATPVPEDPDPSINALIWHAREKLAMFKCPSKVTFIPEIPRNAAGKVLKAELRAPYWAGRDRRV